MRTSLVALLLAWPSSAFAQAAEKPDQEVLRSPVNLRPGKIVTVVPGEEYAAGKVHRMLLGAQYRRLWTTPIEVRVLDLEEYAGGLTPEKRSGSRQTVGLRFKGADGLEYNFRSVDKEPANALPSALKNSLVEKIFQDQMSAQYPAAAVIASSLLDAAGVLHPHPELYVMPDDPRLGEFREQFAGLLGTIEEHRPRFPGARDIVETQELFDSLQADPAQRVDAPAYLTARLMDVLMGDWDRHADQWQWAAFRRAPGEISWRAVPEDRDWAFAKMDGPIAVLVRQFFPQTIGFDDDYPPIMDLTWTAKDLDRRLLSPLDRSAWDSVVAVLQARLTDSVLARAVRRQPAALYEKYGATLEAALRSRRDHLPEAAAEFYALLNREVDVHGVNAAERVEIEHQPDGGVLLTIRPRDRRFPHPTFRRHFVPEETREVRVYVHGGADIAVARGEPNGIKVRVIGEPADSLLDSTSVAGVFFYPDRVERPVEKEDDDDAARDRGPSEPRILPSETFAPAPRTDEFLLIPPVDWGHRWVSLPWAAFHPGQGLVLGLETNRYGYGFRAVPYRSRVKLKGGWAFGARGPRLEAYWEDREFITVGLGTRVEVHASKVEVVRFYGFGNESAPLSPSRDARTLQDAVTVEPAIYNDDGRLKGSLGPFLQVTHPDRIPGTRLDRLAPPGAGGLVLGGLQGRARLDVGNPIGQGAGMRLGIDARLARQLGGEIGFFRTGLETAGFVSLLDAPLQPMLAVRAGVQRVWGDYPFQEAAYVGGQGTIRGFDKQRFQGDASAYVGTEARIVAFDFHGSVLGALVAMDAGRVFLEGESSTTWHRGYAAGVWGGVPGLFTVNLVAGKSVEQLKLYVYTGFGF